LSRKALIVFVILFAVAFVGTAAYAYLEHKKGKALIAKLEAFEKAANASQTKRVPRPFLPKAERAAIANAFAARDASAPEAAAPVHDPAYEAALQDLAKTEDEYAVRIHTLWKAIDVAKEVDETERALKKCSDAGTDLVLVVKKAGGREKRPVLVVGDPPIGKETAPKYATCLQSQLPVYEGKTNQVEAVALSDFEEGYSDVIRVRQSKPRQ
jgi:hypothetical protein